MTIALGVRQPLHQQNAGAFGEHRAVGTRSERPDLTAARQVLLAAEVDEGDRGGHHGDPAGQRHRAFAGPQRLDREVEGDQRGGTGGVHRYGRTFKSEQIGNPAGENTAVGTAAEKGSHFLRRAGNPGAVVVVHDSGEDPGFASLQREGVDPGAFDGFPGNLQHQPLLRVHGQRFARGDAEECRVELRGLVQESALADVRGTAVPGVRVVERVNIPATVGGEVGDAVLALGDQVPEILRRRHPARVPAGHSDDRDRLGFELPDATAALSQVDRRLLQILDKLLVVRHLHRPPQAGKNVDRIAVRTSRTPGRRSRVVHRRRHPGYRCSCRVYPLPSRRRDTCSRPARGVS